MILTLMCIGFIIVGAIFTKVRFYQNFSYKVDDALETVAIILLAVGIIGGLFTSIFAIGNTIFYDVDYQDALHEREIIEYRLEHMEDNLTGNEMLYNDIVEFNNELRHAKKWANNPWTNWFNNKKIAALDYIEIGGE